ncbi:HslU--HslV peptidase ATPase subunit, partial [Enterococcus faecium]|nr:HslU--HslV peptidase ATPase subunit [Enterococcus faecium]
MGRDVESMVRDLVENAVHIEEENSFKDVRAEASKNADRRIVELLVPVPTDTQNKNNAADIQNMMNMLNQLQQGRTPDNLNQSSQKVPDDIKEKRMNVASKLAKG